MSTERLTRRGRTPRSVAAAVPAALAGSIALVLTATPANAAATRADEPMLRSIPAAGERAAGLVLAVRVATAAAPEVYTVQRGDTISAIAARFGLRTTDVLALNGLGWRSVIYPGQVLRLIGTAPAPAAPVAPVAPVASAPVTASAAYTVQKGDTVSAIAKRHGVSTQSLLTANGLGWSSIIRPGQVLVIAGATAAAPAPTPATPPPAATPTAPVGGGAYTIKAGDTISSIASRHGVSTSAVLSANKLSWSSIIYPGQTIVIPLNAAPVAVSIPGLSAEQVANVQVIVQVGRQLGVPDRGIAIALGAAMTESGIRNLDWGDRDSLGIFQQRPSYGWGTPEEIRDPVRAAKAFYGGPSDPNGWNTRGLLDYPGWESMTFTQAAQAVQNSAYPDAYARWEQSAHTWLAALG